MTGVERKEKRGQHRTRTTMDFESTTRILQSQKEVDKYLAWYDVCLPSNIKVVWCPLDTDYTEAPDAGGV